MNVVNEDDDQELTKLCWTRRSQIKREIRKLKAQNRRTYKYIKFCNRDFSSYEIIFKDEILLYDELTEELECTKELFNLSIKKNIEKIENYIKLLNMK